MNNFIKSWNGRTIRIRNDRYVSLTDMAQATGEPVNPFLTSQRVLSIIAHFYRRQTGQIRHPILEEDGEVWVCFPLAVEFCYQSRNYEFSIWMDDILWADIINPEVLPYVLNAVDWRKHRYPEIDKTEQVFPTFVYFIFNADRNTVKIGYSKNPEARIKAFQTGTLDDLSLLKTMLGGKSEEDSIHRQFSDYRIEREIFRYEGKLKKFVESLP